MAITIRKDLANFFGDHELEIVSFQCKKSDFKPYKFRTDMNGFALIDGRLCGITIPINGKFAVFTHFCQNDLGGHKCVFVTDKSLAVYLAHVGLVTPRDHWRFFKRGHANRHLDELQISAKIVTALVNRVDADEEYNQVVGCPEPPPVPVRKQALIGYVKTQVDDLELYSRFKKYFLACIEGSFPNFKHFGARSSCLGTLECLPDEYFLLHSVKSGIDYKEVLRLARKNGYPRLVTEYPKFGAVRSDGSCRMIYPMNVMLECVQRYFIGGYDLGKIPHCQVIRGRAWPKRNDVYMHDITACDTVILPYVGRLSMELNMPYLYPYIHSPTWNKPHRFGFPGEQYPSGVYPTTLLTTCFAAALAHQTIGERLVWIQGDGIMSTVPICSNLVRKTSDANGFKYDAVRKQWVYNRGHRLFEPKWSRGNGPTGKDRFRILNAAYILLGADVDRITVPCHPSCLCETFDGRHLDQMEPHEALICASKRWSELGRAAKIALEEIQGERPHVFDSRGNSWECLPREVRRMSYYRLNFPRTAM